MPNEAAYWRRPRAIWFYLDTNICRLINIVYSQSKLRERFSNNLLNLRRSPARFVSAWRVRSTARRRLSSFAACSATTAWRAPFFKRLHQSAVLLAPALTQC